MKQIAVFIVILLTLCLSASSAPIPADSGSGGEFALTDEERAYLDSIRGRTVSLGVASGVMSFTDVDGNPAGMLLPFINLLEEEFGLTVKTGLVEWGKAFELLDDGIWDMFGLAVSSTTRSVKYLATDTLYTSSLDIYSRIGDPLESLMNLDGKTIAFVENSVLPQIVLKYVTPTTSIKYYSEIEDMLAALESGEIDCIFTSQSVQAELLNHPGMQYEMHVTGVQTPQCIYSGNKELEGLIGIINRYLSSDSGERLRSDIKKGRSSSILQAANIHFKEDIKYIRENYERLQIYDNGVLYPLCYLENGEYKGLQQEINDVFFQLTGVPVEIRPSSDFENGLISAISMIDNGDIAAATSTHLNNVFVRNTGFIFSEPVMSDKLRIYSLVGDERELSELKIGTTTYALSYVDWPSLVKQSPVVYASNDLLMSALKQGEIDAVFFGEMNADYYYTIQRDYTLKRVGNISVDTAYYIMMAQKNESFNRLFTESVKLQRILNPEGGELWTNASLEDKFAFMRLQARISGYQNIIITACVVLFFVLSAFLFSVWYQYRKFSTYDKQISTMLATQKNADMIWGNSATGKLISKGNFPIYRSWGLNNYPDMSLTDAFAAEGFLDDIKNDMKEIGENGLAYNVEEKAFFSRDNGGEHYMRRYTHMINENEFMVLALDVTDEKQREAALSDLANTDPLSKLRNRRSMQEVLSRRSSRLSQCTGRLFIIMIDVDNFKNINDSYGHEIGDNVLVGIASSFAESAPSCIASRWGGEEFLIAIEAETPEAAIDTANRIREGIARKVFPVGTRTSFSITVSCGMSELLPGEDVNCAVRLADEAMYTAKKSGKNCVKTNFTAG